MKGTTENFAEKDLHLITNDDVVSINDRKKLDKLKESFPNVEIIIGKVTENDKPVPLGLIDMEHDRQKIFDAATESVLGQRVDRLEKRVKFPMAFVTFVFGLMSGVALTYLAFNMFILAPK